MRRRLICMVAAHEYRTVRHGESRVLQCERCGKRKTMLDSRVDAGRYTWDFGPD